MSANKRTRLQLSQQLGEAEELNANVSMLMCSYRQC